MLPELDVETRDEVIEEVRRIKEDLAARFDFDVHRIVADAQQRQIECGRQLVTIPERTPLKPQN